MISVPDAVAIVGVAIAVLAAWRGNADAGKAKDTLPPPAKLDTVEINARYTRAMEANTAATREMAKTLDNIATILDRWVRQYDQDKSDGKIEALEMQIMQLYNSLAPKPAESRPLPRRKPRNPT